MTVLSQFLALHSSCLALTKTDLFSFYTRNMATIMKWAITAFRRAPSPPVCFPTSGFEVVRPSEVLNEERFEQFKQGQYYPTNIGDVLISKYQIIGKLGFGTTSTVWLARDLK